MKTNLKLHYYTQEGAKLQIVPVEGKPMDMHNDGDGLWSIAIELHSDRPYRYAYRVVEGRKVLRQEWGEGHSLTELSGVAAVEVLDHWCDEPQNKPLYSSMFSKSIFKRNVEVLMKLSSDTHYIEVEAALLPSERDRKSVV